MIQYITLSAKYQTFISYIFFCFCRFRYSLLYTAYPENIYQYHIFIYNHEILFLLNFKSTIANQKSVLQSMFSLFLSDLLQQNPIFKFYRQFLHIKKLQQILIDLLKPFFFHITPSNRDGIELQTNCSSKKPQKAITVITLFTIDIPPRIPANITCPHSPIGISQVSSFQGRTL